MIAIEGAAECASVKEVSVVTIEGTVDVISIEVA